MPDRRGMGVAPPDRRGRSRGPRQRTEHDHDLRALAAIPAPCADADGLHIPEMAYGRGLRESCEAAISGSVIPVLNVREQLMKQRPAAVRPKQRAFVASASPYPATGGIQAFISCEEPGGFLDRPPFHLVSLAPGPPSGSESRLRPSTGGRFGKLDPRPFRRDSLPRLPTSRARETR